MMLSGAMLLDFLGERAAGDAVRVAVRDVVGSGVGTPDLGLAAAVGTREFGERVLAALA
jgi:tartrate dehydrogenase/decarboxylase/D-malate dehydrogenase